jgi:hypothetical protein
VCAELDAPVVERDQRNVEGAPLPPHG